MRNHTILQASAGLAAVIVLWRTGLLQGILMMPFSVIRGILSPLVTSPDRAESESIAGAVLNITTDHNQVTIEQVMSYGAQSGPCMHAPTCAIVPARFAMIAHFCIHAM